MRVTSAPFFMLLLAVSFALLTAAQRRGGRRRESLQVMQPGASDLSGLSPLFRPSRSRESRPWRTAMVCFPMPLRAAPSPAKNGTTTVSTTATANAQNGALTTTTDASSTTTGTTESPITTSSTSTTEKLFRVTYYA